MLCRVIDLKTLPTEGKSTVWNQICKSPFSLNMSEPELTRKISKGVLKIYPLFLNRILSSPGIVSPHTLSLKICKALWKMFAFQPLSCCFEVCLDSLSCTCCLPCTPWKNAVLTYILDSGSGMTWEPHGKWLLRLTKRTLLVAALWLGETPAGCLSLGRKHSFCCGKSYQVTLPGQKEKAGPMQGVRSMESWGFSLESRQQLGSPPDLTYPEHIFMPQSKAIF